MPPSVRLTVSAVVVALALSLPVASAQPSGAELFRSNCASCHQPAGEGLPGIFPPLAGHVSDIYEAEGGSRHLANVLLFGMQGPITVNGQDYDGMMPAWFAWSDEDIAAVLDYVMTAWGDAEALVEAYQPITAEEVAAARRGALSPQLVHQRRPDLATSEDDVGEDIELPLATFSQAQVDRAVPLYERQCAECHGDDLNGGLIGGPPLRGPYFDNRWGGQSVAGLFSYTKSRMPQHRPDSLSSGQYADLVALILSMNGHETGESELVGDLDVLDGLGIRSE